MHYFPEQVRFQLFPGIQFSDSGDQNTMLLLLGDVGFYVGVKWHCFISRVANLLKVVQV